MPDSKMGLGKLFGQLLNQESAEYDVTGRVNRVAESILENEGLLDQINDAAAQELLDWGLACATMIAQSTANLDDAAAEEAMSPRLRATRRLMRRVNKWVVRQQEKDAAGSADVLAQIIEQAAIIYGEDFIPPDEAQCAAFASQQAELADNPQQMIKNLRQLLDITLAQQGDNNDQEKH
jgi:hypothetical protein